MTDNWETYITNVNDELASIVVNLGLHDVAPVLAKPWLLWIWIYMQAPRSDGLSSGEEAPKLYQVEDALLAALAEACGALHCGRITTLGRREFYLYATTETGFRDAAQKALTEFPQYRYSLGSQHEEHWGQYLNVLYPTPVNLEFIKNQRVLDVLSENGDIHTFEREVAHWLYFLTESTRDEFLSAATTAGYKEVAKHEATDGGASRFCAVISRVQAVERPLINKTTRELLRLFRR